ncbi:cysteine dioxygenase [Bordetella sp. BOR01]|uniref:cysteine dioxygenase family protein n=1 Tax=Bordetella sp. BOR01 TaxID=2854779 RepID=UPI001C495D89|nr:cysteine dioxygenase [Bordetella sp. BOR01]MBV7486541.1 cysteine dioxygenase [Bordetella sp. BOR01]
MHPRLKAFVDAVDDAVDTCHAEPEVLSAVSAAMARLVAVDDWLDPACAVPHPDHYQQFLLHLDPAGRFSVVSFVWGPGQRTPIHDHTVWGIIGMLRGAETGTPYSLQDGGLAIPQGPAHVLQAGQVDQVSPSVGDVHRVQNASADEVSISIHCYGADIGQVKRHVYYDDGAPPKAFVSGYSTQGTR